jgi:hypothetical protein
MIQQGTFDAVGLLAANLNTAGVRLGTLEGSAASLVVSAGYTPLTAMSQEDPEKFIELYKQSLERGLGCGLTNQQVTEGSELIPISEHEETIVLCKNKIRGLISGILDRSRNQVKPFITSVLKSAEEIPTRKDIIDSLYEVVPVAFDERWNDPIVAKMLGALSDVIEYDFNHDDAALTYPHIDAETVIITGHERYDEIIKEVLEKYNYSFADLFKYASETRFPRVDSSEGFIAFDRLLAVLLICAATEERPWENTKLSLDAYTAMMSKNTNILASWVREYLANYQRAIQEGTLIGGVGYVDQITMVYVYAPSMEQFQAQGGTVEAIQGMFLLEDDDPRQVVVFNKDQVLERLDTYVNVWERHVTITKEKDNQQWIEAVRGALIRGFMDAMSAQPDLVVDDIAASKKIQEFREYVYDKVQLHMIDDLQAIIMDACEELLFKGEQTVEFLRLVDFNLKEGMPKEKALEQATLTIFFDWMVAQVTVNE